jgi:hypothetical protein
MIIYSTLPTYVSANVATAQPSALVNPNSVSGESDSDVSPIIPATMVPEPSSAALLICGLALAKRRPRKRQA